jgi:hypothetical protein
MQRNDYGGRPGADSRPAMSIGLGMPRRYATIAGIPGVIGVLIVVILVAISFAWMTSTGRASASVAHRTLQPIAIESVTPHEATSQLLIPGGPPVDASVRINNPNTIPVRVRVIQQSGVALVDAEHAACDPAVILLNVSEQELITIPPQTTVSILLPASIRLSVDASIACMGASFTIPVDVEAIT